MFTTLITDVQRIMGDLKSTITHGHISMFDVQATLEQLINAINSAEKRFHTTDEKFQGIGTLLDTPDVLVQNNSSNEIFVTIPRNKVVVRVTPKYDSIALSPHTGKMLFGRDDVILVP